MTGAVLYEDCPMRTKWGGRVCRCGRCKQCGHRKHTAIHGPFDGGAEGSRPFGHEFVERGPEHEE